MLGGGGYVQQRKGSFTEEVDDTGARDVVEPKVNMHTHTYTHTYTHPYIHARTHLEIKVE